MFGFITAVLEGASALNLLSRDGASSRLIEFAHAATQCVPEGEKET